jgi:hypothetical protein
MDSRLVKTKDGWIQGYNAQAAVNEAQIVVAEVTVDSPDFGHLDPMVEAVETELEAAGVTDTPTLSSRTPAIGTRSRWRRSSAAASRS